MTATFLVACRFGSMASATMGRLTAAAASVVGPAQAVPDAVGDLDVRVPEPIALKEGHLIGNPTGQ